MTKEDNSQPDCAEDLEGPDTAAVTGDENTLQMLEDARNKADEHWNTLLRLRADMENLRKRAERDLENAHKYALERFTGDLLPVKDSLELGLAAATQSTDPSEAVAKLVEGTELTLKMLTQTLEKFGVRSVDPLGERFNPELHQAMSMQPAPGQAPDTVLAVFQKGYTLNDRLIRPAMVIVAGPDGEDKSSGVDVQA
jgi:molecular chaperone GrpE